MNQDQNTQPVGTRGSSQRGGDSRGDSRWESVSALLASGETITVPVTEVALKDGRPCGLNVKIKGLRGFCPGSEMVHGVRNEDLVGKEVAVKVVEVNQKQKGGRLVVSMKAVAAESKNEFLAGLNVDDEVTGVVARITDFGYFVDLGSADALLRKTDTPFVDRRPQVFQVGDQVTARVKSVKADEGKLAVTMRQQGRDERAGSSGASRRETTRFTRPVIQAPAPKPTKVRTASSSSRVPQPSRKSQYTHSFGSFGDLADFLKAKEQPAAPVVVETQAAPETAANAT